jgi:hypothetical protein
VKTKQYSAALVLSLTWAALALSGCCWGGHDPCAHCYPAGFGCFGYHSTCWRPWPEECPTCPSFAIIPPPQETILKDVPLGHEALPPADITPMPPPDGEPAPVVEPPEEGHRQNPQIRKVSKKRMIRPAPADNR